MIGVVALAAMVLACGDDGPSPSGSGTGTASDSADTEPFVTSSEPWATSTGIEPATGVEGTTTSDDDEATADSTGAPACGNGLCGLDEDAASCCEDCGLCSDGATVRMETGVRGGAPGVGLTPGGMADTHATFSGGPFAEVIYPMTVEVPPVDGSSWFWAQQFFFENTPQGGYTGLQSNGIIGGMAIGRMAIFSIWDATEATPGPDASCEPFGGEGVGYSCRLPFEWRANVTYPLRLWQAEPEWWSVGLFDPATGQERLLGTIHAPAGWGLVRPPTAGFAEYYGQVDGCDTLPHAVALLHQPWGDGEAPVLVDAGTYGTCMAQASSVCSGPLCR